MTMVPTPPLESLRVWFRVSDTATSDEIEAKYVETTRAFKFFKDAADSAAAKEKWVVMQDILNTMRDAIYEHEVTDGREQKDAPKNETEPTPVWEWRHTPHPRWKTDGNPDKGTWVPFWNPADQDTLEQLRDDPPNTTKRIRIWDSDYDVWLVNKHNGRQKNVVWGTERNVRRKLII